MTENEEKQGNVVQESTDESQAPLNHWHKHGIPEVCVYVGNQLLEA